MTLVEGLAALEGGRDTVADWIIEVEGLFEEYRDGLKVVRCFSGDTRTFEGF